MVWQNRGQAGAIHFNPQYTNMLVPMQLNTPHSRPGFETLG